MGCLLLFLELEKETKNVLLKRKIVGSKMLGTAPAFFRWFLFLFSHFNFMKEQTKYESEGNWEEKKKYLASGRGEKNQWQTCSGLEMGPNSV